LLLVHRICRWLCHQVGVLLHSSETNKRTGFEKLVKIQLLDRDKVAQTFLKVGRKYGDVVLTAEGRLVLEQ
jgi:hypothetical protein